MSRADRRTLRISAVTAAVAVVVGSAACSSGDLADDEPLINRVGTSGMSLTLDGKPWWPVGVNAYQLGTDWQINVAAVPRSTLTST
jgi:mannan endo-1,4-beta-mannosidase